MSATVEVIIEGRDNTGGMFGGIGTAFSNLGNIVTGIKAGFDLLAGAFNAVVDFGAQFTNEAIESQDAIANLEATLRSMGNVTGLSSQQLQDMAGALQEVTRFSDETIINGQAMLLTFGNIGGDIFPQATEAMLDLAAKFGSVDQASVMLGKALNDPIAGVTALRRVGVQLSDEQEKSIKLFMEQGDIMSAQGIILTELERQVGGLAEAYGQTFAGQLEIFKNKIGEVKEGIGNSLLPLLSQMMDWAMQFMPTIERLGDLIAGVFDVWADAGINSIEMQDQLGGLDEFFADIFNNIASAINEWATGEGPQVLSDAIVTVIDGLSGANPEINSKAAQAALNIAHALGNAFAAIDWRAIGASLGMAIDLAFVAFATSTGRAIDQWAAGLALSIGKAIRDGLVQLDLNAQQWVDDHIINPIKQALGISSPSSVFMDIGRNIVLGLMAGFLGMVTPLIAIINAVVSAILGPFAPILGLLGIDAGALQIPMPTIPTLPGGTGTGTPATGGTVVNQYFAGATINVGKWDEIAYDCIYPNPFIGATSGQLGTGGGGGNKVS